MSCNKKWQQAITWKIDDKKIDTENVKIIEFIGDAKKSLNVKGKKITIEINDGKENVYNELKKTLVKGENIDLFCNDENKTITISATGGGSIFECKDLEECLDKINEIIDKNITPKLELKLSIDKLFEELQKYIKAGNNITLNIDEEAKNIIINSNGGGGGSFTCNSLETCIDKINEIVAKKFALIDDGLVGSGIFSKRDKNRINLNIDKVIDLSKGETFVKNPSTHDNEATSKGYVDDAIKNVKPTHLYNNGIKIFSAIDEEKRIEGISALLTEIKNRCGERGSGHFQLAIQDNNEDNNYLNGFVEKHYNQMESFYIIYMQINGAFNDWLYFTGLNDDTKIQVYVNSVQFTFSEKFDLIGWKGNVDVKPNIDKPNYQEGIAVFNSKNLSYFPIWFYDTDLGGIERVFINKNNITEKINQLIFIINLGYQLGFNALEYAEFKSKLKKGIK